MVFLLYFSRSSNKSLLLLAINKKHYELSRRLTNVENRNETLSFKVRGDDVFLESFSYVTYAYTLLLSKTKLTLKIKFETVRVFVTSKETFCSKSKVYKTLK